VCCFVVATYTGHGRCRCADATPEPDFRYFSRATARRSSANSITASTTHGRCLAVCGHPPLLDGSTCLLYEQRSCLGEIVWKPRDCRVTRLAYAESERAAPRSRCRTHLSAANRALRARSARLAEGGLPTIALVRGGRPNRRVALRRYGGQPSPESRAKVGGPDRDRTGDLVNAIHARSQLRYWPIS
jgi:hypothetical protein